MIVDISGIILTPGNIGKDCFGNGKHEGIECCCNECDYMMCCLDNHDPTECLSCSDSTCPRSANCPDNH